MHPQHRLVQLFPGRLHPKRKANRAGAGAGQPRGLGVASCAQLHGPLPSAGPLRRMKQFTQVFPRSVCGGSVHIGDGHPCSFDVCTRPAVCMHTPLQCVCAGRRAHVCMSLCVQTLVTCICEEHGMDICAPLWVSHRQCLRVWGCTQAVGVHLLWVRCACGPACSPGG